MSPFGPWLRSLLISMIWPAVLAAQTASSEPPLSGRPADFSNIVGAYDITAAASPTHVAVEQPITLRIQITGAGPAKYEPKRETLHLFPEAWARQFYVEEMRDVHQVRRDENTWVFVFRLRPKHTKIDAIDGIKLVYYDPNAPGRRKFVTRFVDPIPIVVDPKADDGKRIEVVVAAAPERFYQNVPLDDRRGEWSAPMPFPTIPMIAFLAGVPLVCLLGAVVWRTCWPDAGERRRRQRNRAAECARAQLRQGTGPVWEIVHQYLHDRFDFTQEEPTPAEASRHLLRLGFAKDLCCQCRTLLQTCDALRYGESPAGDRSIPTAEADRLITALEADPCAR